jgi:putative membrane protein
VIRLLVRLGIMLVANAVGLIVAATVLDGMEIDVTSFIVAVAIYTVCIALLQPFLMSMLRQRGPSVIGGVALFATLASLIITDLVSDGFSIDGIGNWLAAAVIVWVVSLLAGFVLPYLGLKKYLQTRDEKR